MTIHSVMHPVSPKPASHLILPLVFGGLLFLVLLNTIRIYWPGLNGIFLLDDYQHLDQIAAVGGVTNFETLVQFVLGNNIGSTGRPISMLSLLIDDQYWPGDPHTYKYTNLLFHCLTGVLVVWLLFKLLLKAGYEIEKASMLAIVVGALWLFQPLNVSTTLYVIQRMTQLSAIFSLAALLCYVYGRESVSTRPVYSFLLLCSGLFPFALLAVLSKENGVLVLLFILMIEKFFFGGHVQVNWHKWWLRLCVVLPILLLLGYFLFVYKWAGLYEKRDFSMTERLLTEARVLVSYLYQIIVPPVTGTGLIHDDIEISKNLFTPISTLFSVLFLGFLLLFAVLIRHRSLILSFAIIWFFVGHLMESTFIPLELYFEHRNYLPMVGVLLFVVVGLYELFMKRAISRLIRYGSIAVLVGLIWVSSVITAQSARIWADPQNLFAMWAMDHPDSLRANRIFGNILAVEGAPERGREFILEASESFPWDFSLKLEILRIECQYDVEQTLDVREAIQTIENARYSDGLTYAVRALSDLVVLQGCNNVSRNDFHDILFGLEDIQGLSGQNAFLSSLLFLHSDIFVLEGNLNQAITLLDRAAGYQNNIKIHLRRADLLASAGLFEKALDAIDAAKDVDNQRAFRKLSRKPEIEDFERRLKEKFNLSEH